MSTLVMALARHFLGAFGGWLLASGYADAATAESVTGALMALMAFGWSVVEKRGRS